jgi:hypothetical protein
MLRVLTGRGAAVDPVTIGAVLAAVAGGAAGALGAQVWAGVTALVRRPFHHDEAGTGSGAVLPGGAAELAALQQAPADQRRAVALAEVLLTRAAADGGFEDALASWWEQARGIQVSGDVANTVSGGTQYGPVLQGRDFTGLTFTTAPPPAPGPPQEPRT